MLGQSWQLPTDRPSRAYDRDARDADAEYERRSDRLKCARGPFSVHFIIKVGSCQLFGRLDDSERPPRGPAGRFSHDSRVRQLLQKAQCRLRAYAEIPGEIPGCEDGRAQNEIECFRKP